MLGNIRLFRLRIFCKELFAGLHHSRRPFFLLPAFPLLNIASGISSFRAGYNFTEASALKQIAKAQVPVLFIHGSEDNFVHTDMVYRVYEACPTEKQLLVAEGAGHGNSYNHAPDTYFETIFSFLSAQGLYQKQ